MAKPCRGFVKVVKLLVGVVYSFLSKGFGIGFGNVFLGARERGNNCNFEFPG